MNRISNLCVGAMFVLAATAAGARQDPIATMTAGDLDHGKRLYVGQCAGCHGIEGVGGRGPALNRATFSRPKDNAELFNVIKNGIPGTEMPEAWHLTDREAWRVAGYVRSLGRTTEVKLPGDAGRGRELYRAKGCAGCHIVRGEGGNLGPELTEIGARRSAAYLRQSLVDPAAAVPEGFLVVTATTRDGRTVRGARANEDSFTIQLRDETNRFHSFRKSELKNLKKEFGASRPGDNLFTCSLLAVDAASGKIRWHFQFTPHDVHDWDSNQIPVLLDASWQGRRRKLVAMANRNAFYYVLDRATGEFLLGAPYAKQTWSKGLDAKGRPIVLPDTEPTIEGNLVWPSLQGSTNWFSPAYSPLTKMLYVPVREMGAYYYKGEAEYKPGTFFAGGGERSLDGDKAWGAIRALDVATGKMKWEFRLQSPIWAGVLATAGGVVFGGSNEGNFYALDAATGKPLWDFQTGGYITANPISFLVDGKQRIAIAAGQALLVFGLP
jgi:putative heme-binding domain-containing protein